MAPEEELRLRIIVGGGCVDLRAEPFSEDWLLVSYDDSELFGEGGGVGLPLGLAARSDPILSTALVLREGIAHTGVRGASGDMCMTSQFEVAELVGITCLDAYRFFLACCLTPGVDHLLLPDADLAAARLPAPCCPEEWTTFDGFMEETEGHWCEGTTAQERRRRAESIQRETEPLEIPAPLEFQDVESDDPEEDLMPGGGTLTHLGPPQRADALGRGDILAILPGEVEEVLARWSAGLPATTCYATGISKAYRRTALRRFMNRFVLDNGHLPRGRLEIPLGVESTFWVDFDELREQG